MTSLRLAFSFLTRLPVGQLPPIEQRHWARCCAFFPVCGYVLGCLAIAAPAELARSAWRGDQQAEALVLAAVCVTLLAYLTRGLHLDGLCDMFDGLGGGHTPERRLEIMKDSATGSFGATALVLVLILKVTALAYVLPRVGWAPCVAVVVLSRFILTLLTAMGRYPRAQGTAATMVGRTPASTVVLAAAFSAPCLFVPGGAVAAAAMLLIMMLVKRKSDRLIGGVTGDILGGCCEICETAGFLCLVAMA